MTKNAKNRTIQFLTYSKLLLRKLRFKHSKPKTMHISTITYKTQAPIALSTAPNAIRLKIIL